MYANEFGQHDDFKEVTRELKNIEAFLQRLMNDAADRAPKTEDKPLIWLHRRTSNIDVYMKDPKTGAYRGPVTF